MDSGNQARKSAHSNDADLELVALASKELPYRTTAYEELMRRHEKLLFRVCIRIMGNSHDAEDVFQDVMVKAFHGLPNFEGRSSFKTWLCKIAHNTCYTAISRIAKAREFSELLDDGSVAETQMSDAEIDSEKILLSLSPEDRELLTLKYVGDLKFEEIAEVTGLGLSAVKMRVYRAMETLRKKYQNR